MFEFLSKLQVRGLNVYVSDYHRIRLALSTGGKWTLFRLRETLRVLLVRNRKQQETFDRLFSEHFGAETEMADKEIDVLKILEELRALESPVTPAQTVKRVILPDLPDKAVLEREEREETGIFKNIWKSKLLLVFVSCFIIGVIIWQTQIPSDIFDKIWLKAVLVFQKVFPYIGGIFSILLLLSLIRYIYKKFTMFFKPKLRVISDFTGQREFILKTSLTPLCTREFINEFSEDIGYFISEESDELVDVEESVQETCKQCIPEIVFERSRKVKEVLILEDRCIIDPPVYNLANELSNGLAQRGIAVKQGFFYDTPESFITVDDKKYMLEDLEDSRNGYLVLIFSDGQGIEPDNHRRLLEDLRQWPFLFWLETRPENRWDDITQFISLYIPVYPATIKGLRQVARQIRSEHYKKELSPSIYSYQTLENYLQDALPWACACALLQPMDFGVAEQLRLRFFGHLLKEDIQLILDLPGTYRTNAGFKFSNKTAGELLTILRTHWPDQETLWRCWLDEVFESHRPVEESPAYLTWQMYSAMNKLQIDKKSAKEGADMLLNLRNSPVETYASEYLQRFTEKSDETSDILLRSIDRDVWTLCALEKIGLKKQHHITSIIARIIFSRLKERYLLLRSYLIEKINNFALVARLKFKSDKLTDINIWPSNPYIVGEPVTDKNMFFGRDKLMGDIFNSIKDNNILLIGERDIGKTTILKQLEKNMEKPYFCFFCDLEGIKVDIFFHWIMEHFVNKIKMLWPEEFTDYIPKPIEKELSEDLKVKVFINCAEEDINIATKLYNDLIRAGIKPWMGNKDILPGQNWESEIEKAIRDSEFFLALLSSNSVSKRSYTNIEIKIALNIQTKGNIFVIPIRIDECETTDKMVQNIKGLDLFPSYEKGLKKLLRVITHDDTIISQYQSDEKLKLIYFIKESYEYNETDFESDIQTLLQFLQQKYDKNTLVTMCMDGLDTESFENFNILRKLLQDKIRIVTTDNSIQTDDSVLSAHPLYNSFKINEILPLDRKHARMLITKPVKGYYTYERSVIDFILEKTDCKPFYIQNICKMAIDNMLNTSRRKVTLEHLKTVYEIGPDKDRVKVFISYAKEDLDIAKKLYEDIKNAGITPWLDSENLFSDQNWKIEIHRAIKDSSHVIILLSSKSVSKKGYFQKEIKLALDILDEFPRDDIFIIPIRIDECDAGFDRLQDIHHVDLFDSYEIGLKKILHVFQTEKSTLREMQLKKSKNTVFISCAKEDRYVAKRLYNDLKLSGLTPWLNSEDLLPGQDIDWTIKQAIQNSSYFVPLLSSAIKNVPFPKGIQTLVIPVRLDECEPVDERLQALPIIDLFPFYENGLNQILSDLTDTQGQIFISYSYKDEEWKNRLLSHLKILLSMKGYYTLWDDREIEIGYDWLSEIENALNQARVVVMMISANFLKSNFIRKKEVSRILLRRQKEGIRILPIIVKPCSWQSIQWLSSIQIRPKDGEPLIKGDSPEIDVELADIAVKISEFAKTAKHDQHSISPREREKMRKSSLTASIDKRTLRGEITKAFDLEDLEILCSDIEMDLNNDGINLEVNLDVVGGNIKENKVFRLINYLDKAGYLGYLIAALQRSRILDLK